MTKNLFLIAAIAVLLLVVAFVAMPQAAADGEAVCYGALGGAMRVAGDGCTYVFESGSRMRMQPHTVAVADGGVISAAYGPQSVTLAANATATITTTGYVAGDILMLYNPSPTYTLTIADSGTAKLSSAIALAENDWAELWFDGTNWIQTGESDN